MNKLNLLLVSILSLSFLPLVDGEEISQKPRVAFLYSAFRTAPNIYKDLPFKLDRWENIKVNELVKVLDNYDILLFHENCNLKNPQDFGLYKENWLSFLKKGGIILVQEVQDNNHLNWIPSLGPSFQFSLQKFHDFQKSNDWTNPKAELNFGPIKSSWAHFTSWSPEWIVTNKDGHDLPIVLYQRVGKGLILVTTSYYSRGFLREKEIKSIYNLILKERAKSPLKVRYLSWGKKFLGENKIRIEIENIGKETLDIIPEVNIYRTDKGKIFVCKDKLYQIKGEKEKKITLPYHIEKGGLQYINLTLYDRLKERIYFRTSEDIKIEPLEDLITQIKEKIKKNREEILLTSRSLSKYIWFEEFSAQQLKRLSSLDKQSNRWGKDLEEIASLGEAAWRERFESIQKETKGLDLLSKKLDNLKKREKTWKALGITPSKDTRFVISSATSLEKVFRDKVWNRPVTNKITLQMAANEYESTQLIIIPLIDKLNNIRVTCTDLISKKSKNKIGSDNIDIWPVGYISCGDRWWPDPLLHKKTFDIDTQVVQPVWITVYAPPKTMPGEYKGTLTISLSNAPEKQLPISVKVWDFELSKELVFTDFAFRVGEVVNFFYGKEGLKDTHRYMPASLYREYLQFFLDYRITPQMFDERGGQSTARVSYLKERWEKDRLILDFDEFDKNVELMRRNGVRFIQVGYFRKSAPTGEFGKFWKRYLPQIYEHLKEKGWLDTSYIYLLDEPGPEDYDIVKEQASLVGRLAPGIKRLCVEPINDYFTSGPERYIDIWVPLIPSYNTDLSKERRKKGESVFFYVACVPARPNLFIYQPSIEHRILFWLLEKYKSDGFLYWGLCVWYPNSIENINEDGSPKKSFLPYGGRFPTGDGYLAYPASKEIKDGLNPSIRLEVIRDGLEDFEYFRLLKERLKELKKKGEDRYQALIKETNKVLEIEDSLVKDNTDYTKDPEKI